MEKGVENLILNAGNLKKDEKYRLTSKGRLK